MEARPFRCIYRSGIAMQGSVSEGGVGRWMGRGGGCVVDSRLTDHCKRGREGVSMAYRTLSSTLVGLLLTEDERVSGRCWRERQRARA